MKSPYWLCCLTLLAGPVFAKPVSLQERQQLSFGAIGNNGNCSMNFDGQLSGSCYGIGQPALVWVKGDKGAICGLTVQDASDVPGISLNLELDNTTVIIGSKGQVDVYIAGTISVFNASPGSHDVGYVLTVNYE